MKAIRKRRPTLRRSTDIDESDDRRKIRNNLPYSVAWPFTGRRVRPRKWTKAERDAKLKRRADIVKLGLTLIISVAGSAASFIIGIRDSNQQTQADVAVMRADLNAFRAASAARADEQRRDIDRLYSYFGVPPPRNPGQQ